MENVPAHAINSHMMIDRYHRQTLLPFVGNTGQAKLAAACVMVVGCGALGGTVAEQLCRAGVDTLVLIDRDWVELTNLQRQVLFDESDAREAAPKAIAAARRLSAINSSISIEPHVTDLHAGNIESLIGFSDSKTLRHVDVMVDATDNADTRYLLNDVSVKHSIPWVYGGCVGADGRVMTIRPPTTPCLRCVFPNPPVAGELATCDTAGVLGPAASVVASLQAAAVLRLLLNAPAVDSSLLSIDVWKGRFTSIDIGQPNPQCLCCGNHQFDFLDQPNEPNRVTLCGRNAVQLRPADSTAVDLSATAERLFSAGEVTHNRYLLRFTPSGNRDVQLTLFPDGRTIVQGTSDPARARIWAAQYLGI